MRDWDFKDLDGDGSRAVQRDGEPASNPPVQRRRGGPIDSSPSRRPPLAWVRRWSDGVWYRDGQVEDPTLQTVDEYLQELAAEAKPRLF